MLHVLFYLYVFLSSMHDLLAFIHFRPAIFTTISYHGALLQKKAVDNNMLMIRVLSSVSPARFPHYHPFHRPHPLATGTRVAGRAVPNGPGAAFQPPGNWEEEVLGAWIHVAWPWPHCRYINLGHRYFAIAAYWERQRLSNYCRYRYRFWVDPLGEQTIGERMWKVYAKLQVDIRIFAWSDCTSQWSARNTTPSHTVVAIATTLCTSDMLYCCGHIGEIISQ